MTSCQTVAPNTGREGKGREGSVCDSWFVVVCLLLLSNGNHHEAEMAPLVLLTQELEKHRCYTKPKGKSMMEDNNNTKSNKERRAKN
jgi:hypothetical protein